MFFYPKHIYFSFVMFGIKNLASINFIYFLLKHSILSSIYSHNGKDFQLLGE
jgi:hypothetical protein